jgi:hypothetical protein
MRGKISFSQFDHKYLCGWCRGPSNNPRRKPKLNTQGRKRYEQMKAAMSRYNQDEGLDGEDHTTQEEVLSIEELKDFLDAMSRVGPGQKKVLEHAMEQRRQEVRRGVKRRK